MPDKSTQVAVIGAGPGGYAAAFLAADLGMDVSLIDPEANPGGVCLYRGCIPSKALLHAAQVLTDIKDAGEWGLSVSGLKVDHDKLREWKNSIVSKLTGGLGQLVKQRKISHLRARAVFSDSRTLEVTPVDGETYTLAFENAIIATGSRPITIPPLDAASNRLINSTGALELESIPKNLLVVGGGYIGAELGSVYAALGSKVTIVEMTAGLLPGVDRDLVRILKKRLDESLEAILLNTTVKEVQPQKNGLKVVFQSDGKDPETRVFERILSSVGRRPNSEDLGLEHTAIKINEQGFIQIDNQRRTSEKHILAIGDVAGEPMLAHKATHEGRVAAEVIAGRDVIYEPSAIPAVVFTDPEIAWAGLSETEAKAQGKTVQVSRFPWGASGRAATLGRSEGLTKVIVEPETDTVLGVGIVGPGAGEMIAEGVLAIEMGAKAVDLGLTIHPHPTLSETIMEAADAVHGTSTHIYRPKRKR
ncbi:Dihydrolipoamide dehydrogenase of pyruvate dehydrogenase complex (EC [Olavius algarvensis associated proteobacterium Delta 3]|nr:Dihydrolipoamide dehydrogenase of pyruvate dehydrogenase complex (EC [Olavius algarvensis associated proteobacterium Delta 3]CAB5166335.1 Dihydrolipoamide dehydrogenase of pyruvate dehydrogenase complex (EC [Olavius algarvensis associated proteobacterium Delta 3]